MFCSQMALNEKAVQFSFGQKKKKIQLQTKNIRHAKRPAGRAIFFVGDAGKTEES